MRLSFRTAITRSAVLLALAALLVVPALCQDLKPIQLPQPQIFGGMPLMQALAKRQTTRAFANQPLPLQTLSNLLWAAFGVNRPAKAGLGPHGSFGHEQAGSAALCGPGPGRVRL